MTATVSSKYEIVIPQEIRDILKIGPGQKVAFIRSEGSVKLVRVPELEELRGIAAGGPPFEREKQDREF